MAVIEELPTGSTVAVEDLPPTDSDLDTYSTAPALPPTMSTFAPVSLNSDEENATLQAQMSQTPLFMTSTDDTYAPNAQLEALRALAYEGTALEIAENFRAQGNESHVNKNYSDAATFYSKGLEALSPSGKALLATTRTTNERDKSAVERAADAHLASMTASEHGLELASEQALEERLLLNRSAANLALHNYRRTISDTTTLLSRNSSQPKAHYRLAQALLALHRPAEAVSILSTALPLLPTATHPPLLALRSRAEAQHTALLASTASTTAASSRRALASATLNLAFRQRGIATRRTAHPPADLPADVAPHLAVDSDPASTLFVPTMVLYPRAAMSDLVRAIPLDSAIGDHLDYLLPPPWDTSDGGDYRLERVKVFVAAPTEEHPHRLVGVGRRVGLEQVLREGRVVLEDGLLRVMVVPVREVAGWLKEWKIMGGGGWRPERV